MVRWQIPEDWDVPAVFRKRLGEEPGRQRTMEAGGHLLLVLHAPPRAEEGRRTGRLFWRTPDGAWRSDALGGGIAALRSHLEEYGSRIRELDRAEDRAANARDYFAVLEQATPLRRAARNLHAALQQARDLVPGHDRGLIVCRDEGYAIERYAELTHADAKNGLDFAMARNAEAQAQAGYDMAVAGHRLNVLVAIFFPIATAATVFSMKFSSGLERRFDPWLFWAVVAGGVALGAILQRLIFRPPKAPSRTPLKEDPLSPVPEPGPLPEGGPAEVERDSPGDRKLPEETPSGRSGPDPSGPAGRA